MQKKINKSQSIKFAFKPKKKKKSSIKPLDLYLYYTKPSCIEDKYYYKYLKYANKDF